MARKTLSKKLRFDVFKRDGFKCQYCGITPEKEILQVDHIIPVAEGGENDIDNLITSCPNCNNQIDYMNLQPSHLPYQMVKNLHIQKQF